MKIQRTNDYLEKIEEMYNLQKKLNDQTIKTDLWYQKYSPNGMKINWLRYAKMEASELIESFPIKHWKDINKKANFLNAKVELVDIWHFLLSKIIEEDLAYGRGVKGSIIKISTIFYESYKEYESFLIIEENHIKFCELFEKILCEFDLCLAEDSLSQFIQNSTINKFIKVNCALGLSFNDLYKLYIGKNCLNQLRQDNGYKEGTYKKIWFDNKEDNEIMYDLLAANENINYEFLYSQLEQIYKNLK